MYDLIPKFHLGPFANEDPHGLLPKLLGLLILVLIIVKFIVPALQAILKERAERIEEVQMQVERALTELHQTRDNYANSLKQIEVEARERIDAAVREAEDARAGIIAEAETAAAALHRRAEDEIARESSRQRIMLRKQIVQMTLDAAEASVLEHTSEKVQRQLIGDFIQGAAVLHVGGAAARGGSANGAPPASTTTSASEGA